MLRARMVGTQVKQQLTNATNEYNDLYKQAQHFIHTSKDHHKINQLLGLLDPIEREKLQAEQKKVEENEAKLKVKNDQTLKSGNAKLVNFMQTVWEMGATKEQFASEIERYFAFHSLRKANMVKQLEDQLNNEIDKGEKITTRVEEIEQLHKSQESQLYVLFIEHIGIMKEDMRQRRTLNQLKNIKSIKIRTDQIEIPDINSINISSFKAQEKKRLIETFFADDRVSTIVRRILSQQVLDKSISKNNNNNSSYQSGNTRPNTTTAYHGNNNNSTSMYDRILNEPIDSLMNANHQ